MLVALGDVWWVETLDGELCAAVGAQDGRRSSSDSSTHSMPRSRFRIAGAGSTQSAPVGAFLLRGAAADAEVAARRGVEIASTTDNVLLQAGAFIMLAEVLDDRGLAAEAADARTSAIERLRAKGHLAAVARLER